MKLLPLIFAAFILLSGEERHVVQAGKKNKKKKKKSGKMGGKDKTLKVRITNLSYAQIFSPFFIMVHDAYAPPLYTLGEPDAGKGLKELAENGDTSVLTSNYEDLHSVHSVATASGPIPPGGHEEYAITVKKAFPYVTVASMAISTNDCFVAVNGMKLNGGFDGYFPGIDAGTEGNTELCADFPGPRVPTTDPSQFCGGNGTSDGEGFVHIHRGVHGINDMESWQMDWRNPMMRVQVMNA